MNWAVVLDAESFDIPICEFSTRGAAEIYLMQLKTLTHQNVLIKPIDEVRILKERFLPDNILVDLSII